MVQQVMAVLFHDKAFVLCPVNGTEGRAGRGPAHRARRLPGESGRLRAQRGGVAVETALVLPMLCLLVIGGWILGYMAFAKVALTMTANRAARDFAAATALHDRLKETNRAYRYDGGFAESFGLPRWAVHALIMRTPAGDGRDVSDQAVVVATCYRIPLTMPRPCQAAPGRRPQPLRRKRWGACRTPAHRQAWIGPACSRRQGPTTATHGAHSRPSGTSGGGWERRPAHCTSGSPG